MRRRYNFLEGTTTDNPLTNVATTITSAELADLPAVSSPDVVALVLDSVGADGDPEIVHVTAHTAAATSATISRAKEGTTARQHASGTVWQHNPTAEDLPQRHFARSTLTTGNKTLNQTAWTNLDTSTDLVLPAAAGDFVEVALCGLWGNESPNGNLDVVSIVSGSVVNSWAYDGAVGAGAGAILWFGTTNQAHPISGALGRFLVAGDISGGTVTLRVRYKLGTAANKTLYASTLDPFSFIAKNLGPTGV